MLVSEIYFYNIMLCFVACKKCEFIVISDRPTIETLLQKVESNVKYVINLHIAISLIIGGL